LDSKLEVSRIHLWILLAGVPGLPLWSLEVQIRSIQNTSLDSKLEVSRIHLWILLAGVPGLPLWSLEVQIRSIQNTSLDSPSPPGIDGAANATPSIPSAGELARGEDRC